MPKRQRAHLGQVFLSDKRVELRIVEALRLNKSDPVLEIGAGPGNMTERLAERAAKVIAVELDPNWAAALRDNFRDQPNVQVLEADILRVPIGEVARAAGRERVRVFGNLPYYITSPTLLHLFQYIDAIDDIIVMVQREVANRIAAEPGSCDYGLLSVTCQYYTRPELLFSIPPYAFRRPPRVHSALVRMTVHPQKKELGVDDEESFWKWMRAAFAQKRKTLLNNWKGMVDREDLRAAMEQQGIDPRARAEALSLAQLAALWKSQKSPR
jgi:16S rRNA (adenine1518-N6/adenine1519-N6)-dimethyltransferase